MMSEEKYLLCSFVNKSREIDFLNLYPTKILLSTLTFLSFQKLICNQLKRKGLLKQIYDIFFTLVRVNVRM